MKPLSPFAVLLAATFLSTIAPDAVAQGRASANTGSTLFSGGGSSFGGGAAGAAGGALARPTIGQGGIGQGGIGQLGGQGLGFGAQTGGTQNGGFVGRSAENVTDFFQMLNPNANQAGASNNFSPSAMNRGRDANAEENVRPPILVNVKLGFRPPAVPAQATMESTQRLNQILFTRGLGDARVAINDGVAVVSGIVTSKSDLLLIERLVRLEPGVNRVETLVETADELPTPSR